MKTLNYKEFLGAYKSAYSNLENNKQTVNNLNVFPVPDGDTGTNMALTAFSALEEVNLKKPQTCGGVSDEIARGALMGARGNSGVILSQLLRGFSKGIGDSVTIEISDIVRAFNGAKEMAYKAVMKPTEGTILTVAREIAEFAEEHEKEYDDIILFLEAVYERGCVSLENTPNLLSVLKEAGVVDAGGRGLLFIIEGAIKALKGEPVEVNVAPEIRSTEDEIAGIDPEDIEFMYCTEFLVLTDGKKDYKDFVISKLVKLGDSLVVVQQDDIVKIHVHTNEPWVAMKICASMGELYKIKIENMKAQARAIYVKPEDAKPQKKQKYGVIAVCPGDGFKKMFKDIGVYEVIEGGQTMNPSTEDFLKAMDKINAENYILLPNNKNIILAALQASDITDKSAFVIETKNVPQAISAMLSFNAEACEATELVEEMKEAMSVVKTAQITNAVRDTSVDGIEIKEGNFIGVV